MGEEEGEREREEGECGWDEREKCVGALRGE
jgi:hypothetical protein